MSRKITVDESNEQEKYTWKSIRKRISEYRNYFKNLLDCVIKDKIGIKKV